MQEINIMQTIYSQDVGKMKEITFVCKRGIVVNRVFTLYNDD